MTLARKQLISIAYTPYYHAVNRCVRRAFLAGFDRFTQTSFEHRRQWIVNRMIHLSTIFSIDISAYEKIANINHSNSISRQFSKNFITIKHLSYFTPRIPFH